MYNKNHPWGGRLAQSCQSTARREVAGSTPVQNHIILHKTYEPTTGCHVAAHDWATWHINNQPKYAKCQSQDAPRVCHASTSVLPHHLPSHLLTSSCATCHPYSGDTCHPWIGPAVCPYMCSNHLPHVPPGAMPLCRLQELPRHCTDCTVIPFFLPVCLFGQNTISFAYGARLTK
jgi:hypothetical protein